MVNHLMVGERLAEVQIPASRVGHQGRTLVGIAEQDRAQRRAVHARDVVRAHMTLALDKGVDDFLTHATDVIGIALLHMFVLFLSAHVGRIGFHDLADAAQQRGISRLHRFAEPVGDKPRRLERAAERSVKLICRDAFLAGRHQERGLKPLMQLDMAGLENRPDPNRVIGRRFFLEVAPCSNNAQVAQRFEAATLDATIPYTLALRMKPVPVILRLLKAPDSTRMYFLVSLR